MPAKVHAELKVLRDKLELLKAEGKGQVGDVQVQVIGAGFTKNANILGLSRRGFAWVLNETSARIATCEGW